MQLETNQQFRQVHLEITNTCNCACHFCAQQRMIRPKKHMEQAIVNRLISEINIQRLSEKITFHVLGEPSLHPNFFSILNFASKTDLKISLVTNGVLLGDDFGTKLRSYSLDQLSISLQTPDELSFSFRNAPITFSDYKDGILRFLGDTYVNWGKTEYVLRFLSTCFFDKIKGSTSPYGESCSSFSIQKMALSEWACQVYNVIGADQNIAKRALEKLNNIQLDKWSRIRIHDRIRFDIWHMLPWIDWSTLTESPEVHDGDCFYRQGHIAILSNGDVVLCCLDFNGRTALGSINNAKLSDIISSQKAQHVFSEFQHRRVVLPYCRRCMASWQTILKSLGLDPTRIKAEDAVRVFFQHEYNIWT